MVLKPRSNHKTETSSVSKFENYLNSFFYGQVIFSLKQKKKHCSCYTCSKECHGFRQAMVGALSISVILFSTVTRFDRLF